MACRFSVPPLCSRYQLAFAEAAEGSAGGHPDGAEAVAAGQGGDAGGGAGADAPPLTRLAQAPSTEGRKAAVAAPGAAEGSAKRGAPEDSADADAEKERQGKRRKTDPGTVEGTTPTPPAVLAVGALGKAGDQGPGGNEEAADVPRQGAHERGVPTDALARRGLQRGGKPRFTWAECIPPLPLPAMRACGIPLPSKFVKVRSPAIATASHRDLCCWAWGAELLLTGIARGVDLPHTARVCAAVGLGVAGCA